MLKNIGMEIKRKRIKGTRIFWPVGDLEVSHDHLILGIFT